MFEGIAGVKGRGVQFTTLEGKSFMDESFA